MGTHAVSLSTPPPLYLISVFTSREGSYAQVFWYMAPHLISEFFLVMWHTYHQTAHSKPTTIVLHTVPSLFLSLLDLPRATSSVWNVSFLPLMATNCTNSKFLPPTLLPSSLFFGKRSMPCAETFDLITRVLWEQQYIREEFFHSISFLKKS